MPRPKKVESVEPVITEPIAEQPKDDSIVTTCDDKYHLEVGVSIGSGSFVCKYCKKRFVYKDKQIFDYV